ncbi:MAG: methyltransferase domain-containing protein [Xanthomonadales bacterium]|nr:methyltransferase domain-containing protein [Xanthomonadales bacterium]
MEPSIKPAPRSSRDEVWTFFRQWLRRPLSTAAVSPSSRFLARRMVAALPSGAHRIIELGAGTGTFTRALLEQGIAPSDLLAVEFNPALHEYLTGRFPGVQVVQADARRLGESEPVQAFARSGPVQAVISGLGLLAMPKASQRDILAAALALMDSDGVFVQFTYGPVAPVHPEVLRELNLHAVRRGFTLLNVPPASVYTFTRRRAVAVPTISV